MLNYNTFFNIDLEAVRKEVEGIKHSVKWRKYKAKGDIWDDWGRPVNNTPDKH